MSIYFSDYFQIDPKVLKEYGAFNISLVADLPLFIDPFLLFNSKNNRYELLHKSIIQYLSFLKEKSLVIKNDSGQLQSLYAFPEVKQNWFGFSSIGNNGSGLGIKFAEKLNNNLNNIFNNFSEEQITKSSHLEKLCLIQKGVGKDKISDFATNLIQEFLLEYTQIFSKKYIDKKFIEEFRISKVSFNYQTEIWEEKTFNLPKFDDDYVILTPKNLLTKDNLWISKKDLIKNFHNIPNSISNEQLRSQINNYFSKILKNINNPTEVDKKNATFKTIEKYPVVIDYYIKKKEDSAQKAKDVSLKKVNAAEKIYVNNPQYFISKLKEDGFYLNALRSYEESKKKIDILKLFIEAKDGYKLFYDKQKCIASEKCLQLLFTLIFQGSVFDVNQEVNNGRGSVDCAISKGSADKTLVEFKLARNSHIKRHLISQIDIYKTANETNFAFIVIIYFTKQEHDKIIEILKEIDLYNKENVVLIDARKDNKIPASKA